MSPITRMKTGIIAILYIKITMSECTNQQHCKGFRHVWSPVSSLSQVLGSSTRRDHCCPAIGTENKNRIQIRMMMFCKTASARWHDTITWMIWMTKLTYLPDNFRANPNCDKTWKWRLASGAALQSLFKVLVLPVCNIQYCGNSERF